MLYERYMPSSIGADEGTERAIRSRIQACRRRWRRIARAGGRWRTPGSLEALIGVAIVTVAGLIIPGHWGLLTVNPHPLWIVVLAIAVRYGAPSGYVAGGLAAISQCIALSFRPGSSFQSIPAHAMLQPFLFIVIGMVVGHAVRARRRQLAEIEAKYQQASDALWALADDHAAAHAAKVELERQIVGQPDSVTTLYEMAKTLETLEADALYPAILGLVQRFLAAEACACYRVEGAMVERIASLPPRPADRHTTPQAPRGLLEQAISERRVVSVRDRLLAQGPEALGHEPVLVAGPLIGADGAVIGAVAITRLPFVKLTPAAIRLFRIILDWGSTALQNAALYDRSRASSILDAETGAYTGPHMLRLVQQESRRSARYHLPLAIVVLEIDRFDAIPPEARTAVSRTVVAIVRRSLRTVDTLGHHPMPGRFVLVLPMTAMDAVQIAVARIDDSLHDARLCPYGDRRPLAMNYEFVTGGTGYEGMKSIVREAFAEGSGERQRGATAAAHGLRLLSPRRPEPFRDVDERMVGD